MRNVKMSPSFCYCGQPGDITLNMLECVKCKRWFHEECVKCLDETMLCGDRFYIFICSICNAGSECLGRLELNWYEIVQLLLYNLTVSEKRKYFHIDNEILPFLHQNWERFQILGLVASEKDDKKVRVLDVLERFQTRFKCGKEVKKCKSIWALRDRLPPEPPDVLSSKPRIHKDAVVWEFEVKNRRYHLLSLKKSPKANKVDKNGKTKSKLPLALPVRPKNGELARWGGNNGCENGNGKSKQRSKRCAPLFCEDAAQVGLLDSLIPPPVDFNGGNHPFAAKRTPQQKSRDELSFKCLKRTRSREQSIVSNGHPLLDTLAECKTKDVANSLKEANVMAKRVTASGKVQYLLQSNRANKEMEAKEKQTSFQITIFCKCSYCTRLEDLEQQRAGKLDYPPT